MQGVGSAQRQSFDTASTAKFRNSVRIRYQSAALINSGAGIYTAQSVCWRGNAAGLGGFFFWCRFGWELAPDASCRVFVGLSAATSALPVTADPGGSDHKNAIGIGKDSAESIYYLKVKDTDGVQTSNVGLGVAPKLNDLMDVYLWAEPNSSVISARVVDVVTGAELLPGTTFASGLPADSALFRAHILGGTGASSTTAIEFSPVMAYLETTL